MTIVLLLAALFTSSADAAEVTGARLNLATQAIDVDVRYGGGCKEHSFKLKPMECEESLPANCFFDLVDLVSDDYCDAIITTTASFGLKEYGFDDVGSRGNTITIRGDANTSAFIVLPR